MQCPWRADAGVCIVACGQHQDVIQTAASVLRYSAATVQILIAGLQAGDFEMVIEAVADVPEGLPAETRVRFACMSHPGSGFARLANQAYASMRGDAVFVAAGVEVGPEWLERLSSATYSDSTVASASAIGDRAGPLSVLDGVDIRRDALAQPAAARTVIAHAPSARPRIMTAGSHCVYLRRSALERLGGFDERMEDRSEAIAELSMRALSLGMVHIAADDVFVICAGARERQPEHQTDLSAPVAGDLNDERSVLRRSLRCARAALNGFTVTIDARALTGGVGGTQTYIAELILALAAKKALRLRVVVAPDLPSLVAERFEQEPALELISYRDAAAGVELSDVVYRPQQVFTADDLSLLQLLGERVIIGQHDLIAYRSPAYHETVENWQRYRRVTRLAMTVADRVLFFSEHAMDDALVEDLVSRERCEVVGEGADEQLRQEIDPAPVSGVPLDREFLVCLGTDYGHKNRPFAIMLLQALRERDGWDGILVLAGPHVPYGSSRQEEQALLAEHTDIVDYVFDIGPVGEAEKRWLYERAAAVVYPTTYEGFGLVPFEAAMAGTPCVFAPQASLPELAGPEVAVLVPWDAQRSADAVLPLLRDGAERDRHLRRLRERAERSRWGAVSERLVGSCERALQTPYRAAAPRAWQELERESYIVHLDHEARRNHDAYSALERRVAAGLPLIDERGSLLSRDQQRGLMRIASRKPVGSLLLAPFGLLGRGGPPLPGTGPGAPTSSRG
jgi:glycosyltransferase involved in cell wall biosynthesis